MLTHVSYELIIIYVEVVIVPFPAVTNRIGNIIEEEGMWNKNLTTYIWLSRKKLVSIFNMLEMFS